MMPGCSIQALTRSGRGANGSARGSSAGNSSSHSRCTRRAAGMASAVQQSRRTRRRADGTSPATHARRVADRAEQHGLRDQARPERHGAAARAGRRPRASSRPARTSRWPTTCCRSGAAPRATAPARPAAARRRARPRPARSGRRDAPPTDRSRSTGAAPRISCALARNASRMARGTSPDSTMSKPRSRMFQVISSRVSGTSTAWKLSSAMPLGSAVTRAAAQPSPNSRKDRSCSRLASPADAGCRAPG